MRFNGEKSRRGEMVEVAVTGDQVEVRVGVTGVEAGKERELEILEPWFCKGKSGKE